MCHDVPPSKPCWEGGGSPCHLPTKSLLHPISMLTLCPPPHPTAGSFPGQSHLQQETPCSRSLELTPSPAQAALHLAVPWHQRSRRATELKVRHLLSPHLLMHVVGF